MTRAAPRKARGLRVPRSAAGGGVPGSMVRAAAFWPSPPWSTPSGTLTFGVRASDPLMPAGASGIRVISFKGGVATLAEPTSVVLRDPTTIQVFCRDVLNPVGVYIPFNDPGFRGISGGMVNPGELSIRAGAPGDFPWCCAMG